MLRSGLQKLVVCILLLNLLGTTAQAITCLELFGEKKSVLDSVPDRVLTPLELAQLVRDYGVENEAKIVEQLRTVKPDSDGRVYVRLVFQKNLTIWAHRWVGVATDIHDHTESKSGVYILRGRLREEFFHPPHPAPTTRVLKQGRFVGQGGRPFTHRLFGEDDAISLHAYSPRIDDSMSIFEVDSETGHLNVTRTSNGQVPKSTNHLTDASTDRSVKPQPRSKLRNPLENLRSEITYFEQPLPISSYAELVGYKKFFSESGAEIGQAYLLKPLESNVAEFPNHQGDLKPYRTEIDGRNQNLFAQLGFIESTTPTFGKYMSQVPTPQLFTYLKNRYNEKVPENLQIHVGVYASKVVSALNTEILAHWIHESNVAMSNPEFGSVLGTSPQDFRKPVVGGKEKLSTFRHDLEHFGSIVYIPKKVAQVNQHVGQFWEKLLASIKNAEVSAKEFRHIIDNVYLFNRRFHGLTHVLGMLVRENGTIDINKQRILDFGQSAEIETPTVHWTGLGFKPKWVNKDNLPFPNRLFEYNIDNASSKKSLVTIADTYDAVTNGALNQVLAFVKDHSKEFPDSILNQLMQQWIAELRLDHTLILSEEELVSLQNLTLQRYHQMGN